MAHLSGRAADAGRTVPAEPLYEALTTDPDPLAENLLLRPFTRLGAVPL
ncbi:hypothetical protein ACFWHW_13005 [Streptomyces pharetrae]